MKHIFLDTNIIIDLIYNREPFGKSAIQIFQGAESKKYKLYASSHSIATTHYLLKKFVEEKKLRKILSELLNFINIISIDDVIIKKSLKSAHKDFEDAIQMNCAYSNPKIECILTRNIKDFKLCEIDVYTSEEFLNL